MTKDHVENTVDVTSGREDRLTDAPQKHEVIFRDLVRAIRSGQLGPGARLPNEFDLARRYSMSRNSVRRGLTRLQKEGLVEKRQGSGTYVCSTTKPGRPVEQDTLLLRYVSESTESLIGRASGPWWTLLREGLSCGAACHGLQLVDEPLNGGGWPATAAVNPNRVAGVIAVAFGQDKPWELLSHLQSSVPRLLVNRHVEEPDVPWLSIDREEGLFHATRFLLRLGHRRIGFDVLGEDTQPVNDRLQGYRRAFQEEGVPLDDSLIFQGASGDAYLEWPQRLHAILQRQPRPTALLIHHDNRVLHILEVLRSHAIRVPEDLSVIIIDDDHVLSRTAPALSALKDPYCEMGKRAVSALLSGVRGGQPQRQVFLEPQLIMRDSVLPCRV